MCSVADLESCQVWSNVLRTARKDHECSMCGGIIAKGDRYTAHSSMFDGEWTSEKECAPCTVIATRFQEEHTQRGTPGSMRPMLDECIADPDHFEWDEDGERAPYKPDSTEAYWIASVAEMDVRRDSRRAA